MRKQKNPTFYPHRGDGVVDGDDLEVQSETDIVEE